MTVTPVQRTYVDAETRRKLMAFKEQIQKNFEVDNWIELGTLTDCLDLVRGHDRLLRSKRFGDDDYPTHILPVLIEIVGRDAGNLKFIEDYVEGRDPAAGGENISTAPSKNRTLVFAPSVFEVPDEGVDPKLVAVMMPFAPEFEPVFDAIHHASRKAGLTCLRVKDIWENQVIIQDVFALIFRASIVVCDYTRKNPNVFYEAGIAHTLGKTVVPLSQSAADVPFDVAHHRFLPYFPNREGLEKLTGELADRLYRLTIAPELRSMI